MNINPLETFLLLFNSEDVSQDKAYHKLYNLIEVHFYLKKFNRTTTKICKFFVSVVLNGDMHSAIRNARCSRPFDRRKDQIDINSETVLQMVSHHYDFMSILPFLRQECPQYPTISELFIIELN